MRVHVSLVFISDLDVEKSHYKSLKKIAINQWLDTNYIFTYALIIFDLVTCKSMRETVSFYTLAHIEL